MRTIHADRDARWHARGYPCSCAWPPVRQKLPLSRGLCSTSLHSLSASDVPLLGQRFTSAPWAHLPACATGAPLAGNGACFDTRAAAKRCGALAAQRHASLQLEKGERHATEARHIEGNHRAQRQGRKEGGQIAKAICRYRAESGAQVRRKDSEEAQLDIRGDTARWDRSDRAAPVRRSSAPANGRVPRRIPDARRVAATVPCACTRVHRRARTVPSRRKRQAARRFQRDRRTP